MKALTLLAHEAVAKVLRPGDIAIDLTAGNGWDTLFLARCVGSTGHVYAFDIQADAIQATQRLLTQHAADSSVTLHCVSHVDWEAQVAVEHKSKIKATMMNLGYRPNGDKSIVTRADSTVIAVQSVLQWLQPTGVLTVIAYTGHPGGQGEADAVRALLHKLDTKKYEITQEPVEPALHTPILYVVYTCEQTGRSVHD